MLDTLTLKTPIYTVVHSKLVCLLPIRLLDNVSFDLDSFYD